MGLLLTSPSGGQSEVLATLRAEGAILGAPGVKLNNVGTRVSRRYGGSENRDASDPTWEADTLTVLGQLQTLGYVAAFADQTGAVVDLTASPALTSRVRLTASGRAFARAPRPRPRYLGKSVN